MDRYHCRWSTWMMWSMPCAWPPAACCAGVCAAKCHRPTGRELSPGPWSAATMISRCLRRAVKRSIRRIVPSRYVAWSGYAEGNKLAFTFDDGPHPEYTPRILKVLGDAGVRATFFVLGSQAERYPH